MGSGRLIQSRSFAICVTDLPLQLICYGLLDTILASLLTLRRLLADYFAQTTNSLCVDYSVINSLRSVLRFHQGRGRAFVFLPKPY